MDILYWRGDIGGGIYINHSSINKRTTSSLSTPQTTFNRKRSKNQSMRLSLRHKQSDDCIIQTNINSSSNYPAMIAPEHKHRSENERPYISMPNEQSPSIIAK